MRQVEQTSRPSPRNGWRLSKQHQLALALLASLALAAIGGAYAWSAWQGEGDVDQASRIPLEFKVDINHAKKGELMAIPSVGPKMAEAIVAHRNLQGPFKDFEQLQEVPGIGPKKLDKLKNYLLPLENNLDR